MNDAELAAIVVALVGAFRPRPAAGGEPAVPGLDGNAVPLAAAVLGALLGLMSAPVPSLEALARGVGIGLSAVGAMTGVKYAGDKLGAAVGRSLAPAPPRGDEPSRGGNEPAKSRTDGPNG